MTHPAPGGFRGLLYVVRPRVCPSFRASRQRWPRSGQHGSAGREAGRTAVSDDHALPRTTMHDHARPPRTAAHDHSRSRTTMHDRPRLPYLFEEAVPTPPQGGFGRLGG